MFEAVFISAVVVLTVLALRAAPPSPGRTEGDRLAERAEMRRQRRG